MMPEGEAIKSVAICVSHFISQSCSCVQEPVCVCAYINILKILSTDKILHAINTSLLLLLLLLFNAVSCSAVCPPMVEHQNYRCFRECVLVFEYYSHVTVPCRFLLPQSESVMEHTYSVQSDNYRYIHDVCAYMCVCTHARALTTVSPDKILRCIL